MIETRSQKEKYRSLRTAHLHDISENNSDRIIMRRPGDGANDWKDYARDTTQYFYSEFSLTEAKRTDSDRERDSVFHPPSTSFKTDDVIGLYPDPNKFERLHKLHHDVGWDYTGKARRKETHRRRVYYREGDAILQALEVPDHVRQWAITKAIRESTMGFNGNYNGYYGAYLGFALLALADDLEEALSSKWFHRIKELVNELPDEDVNLDPEELADHVFKKYAPIEGKN